MKRLTNRRPWPLLIGVLILLIALLSFSPVARSIGKRFFASLRLAAPTHVNVGVSAAAGAFGNRSLQQVASDMLADKLEIALDESDQPVPSAAAASRMSGFAVRLPAIRRDDPKLLVLGAHAVRMKVDRGRLRTILNEAGRLNVPVSPALDGAVVAVQDARGIRAQYGNCPVSDNSLQGQITGPPPASTDNSDCVVLVESPAATISAPAGLPLATLVEIGLELSGMNPQQAQDFLRTFDWKSTLGLAMPRFIRSYSLVDVGGAKGMLLGTAGRRGPTCYLIWANNGMIFSLTGYGGSAEAAALANSVR